MPEDLTSVQIDFETRDQLRSLATEDMRSMMSEVAWLIRQEYARRQQAQSVSTPAPSAQ